MESNTGGYTQDAHRKYHGKEQSLKMSNWQRIIEVKLAQNITSMFLALSWRVTLEDLPKMHLGSTMGKKEISSCQMGKDEV